MFATLNAAVAILDDIFNNQIYIIMSIASIILTLLQLTMEKKQETYTGSVLYSYSLYRRCFNGVCHNLYITAITEYILK